MCQCKNGFGANNVEQLFFKYVAMTLSCSMETITDIDIAHTIL